MNDQDRRRSPDGFNDDAIFADIVAHLNDEATEAGQAPPLATEDASTDIEPAGQPADETTTQSRDLPAGEGPLRDLGHGPVDTPAGPTQVDPPVEAAAQVWRAHKMDDEYEEHFEPPPVTPLPAGDLQFWAIIVGMTGGPLLLLYLVFFNRDASSYWILIAIAMSVCGFAMLVSRMPGQRNDDDDGARL